MARHSFDTDTEHCSRCGMPRWAEMAFPNLADACPHVTVVEAPGPEQPADSTKEGE